MMTYVQAREALVTAINTAWSASYPTTKLFYENTTQIDLDTVGSVFVTVSIDFVDSVRMEIDEDPVSRTDGEVVFRIFAKEGVGTKGALQIKDFLTDTMKYRTLAGVETGCPAPGAKREHKGYVSRDLIVPFFFYI